MSWMDRITVERMEIVCQLIHGGTVLHLGSEHWGQCYIQKNSVNRVGGRVINLDIFPGGDLQATAEKLPFKPHVFDAVFAGEILEHLSNPGEMLDEVKRVLKPDGRLIVTVPNSYHLITQVLRLAALAIPYLARPGGVIWQSEEHVAEYNPELLTKILKRHGYGGCKIFSKPWGNNVIATATPRIVQG